MPTNRVPMGRRLKLSRRELLAAAAPLALGSARHAAGDEAPRPPKFIREWGSLGTEPGQFRTPISIAIDRRDSVYVTDFKNLRVQRFRTDGTFVSAFPVVADQPGGLAVDRDGNLYVAHWNQHKVIVYSPSGEVLRTLGKKGEADGEFQVPGGMAFTREGDLLVADQGNGRVQKLRPDGTFLQKWGEHGAGDGQFGIGRGVGSRFRGPQFVAVDRDGSVYATEVATPRVQKFTAAGKHLVSFGSKSTRPGGFGGPRPEIDGPIAVCVDRNGRVWVSATNHRVQQFDRDGGFLQSIGRDGQAPGEFHYPHGLAVDSQNRLYVVDTQNARIQQFEL
ncbi:MAG: SMP-30/gluconolactonase/LRE family protein [Actinomycetota bacterium]